MNKHLLTTCLFAGFSSMANAAVIHFPGEEIPISTSFAGVSVDFETGAFSNDLAGLSGAHANFLLGGLGITNDADEDAVTPSWQPVRIGPSNNDPIVNLGLGAIIDGSSPTGTGFGASGITSSHFATFTSGTSGYIGFKITLSDNTPAHGWARVTLQDDNTPGVIHEWAFENTGAEIRIGEIPEPGTMILSILSLTSMLFRRRR